MFYALTKHLSLHIKGIIHLLGFRQWHVGITKAGGTFYVPENGSCHTTLEDCICQAFRSSFFLSGWTHLTSQKFLKCQPTNSKQVLHLLKTLLNQQQSSHFEILAISLSVVSFTSCRWQWRWLLQPLHRFNSGDPATHNLWLLNHSLRQSLEFKVWAKRYWPN